MTRFNGLTYDSSSKLIFDEEGKQVGTVVPITGGSDLADLQERAESMEGVVVMSATDWQVIPAENLVAAFQQGSQGARLFAEVEDAGQADVMLGALEVGVQGLVLKTEDPEEVRALGAGMQARNIGERLYLAQARVTRVEPAGLGDRVCVDMASLLRPGEGLLVGSYAAGLFLVHSECMESAYINSRPFRVNAGAVHAYIQCPQGRTGYLSEIRAGREVLVVDGKGSQRVATVGRAKVERRPMLLVEAETASGTRYTTLLQNAETVRLIGPSAYDLTKTKTMAQASLGAAPPGWSTLSMAELKAGDVVFVMEQEGGRHTGMVVQETITER